MRWQKLIRFCVLTLGMLLCTSRWVPMGEPPSEKQGEEVWATKPITVPSNVRLPLQLPCRKWYGLLVVQAEFPGHQLLNCGLDTAMNACAVPPLTVLRLKLPKPTGDVHLQRLWQQLDAPTTEIPSFSLGTLPIAPLQVVQLDVLQMLSPEIAISSADAPVCWLGGPFLSAFQVTINAEQEFLKLELPNAPLPRGRGAVVMPMKLRNGCPEVMVSLPKSPPFPALVDLTAPISIIPTKVAETLKLQPLESLLCMGTDGKPYRLTRAIAPRLAVGKAGVDKLDVSFLQPPLPVLGQTKPEDVTPALESEAVLGRNFLDRYQLTINYARRQIELIPLPREQAK
ncbi:hypothetical protein [Chthonomonas sp.]|uniref:hypothetical protein n=1 Tax=Chthonomonas sp. TaxID=2282153 RepID=UPI002B4B8A84|nr:hypothetical protein [Chthonomonas sp.]